VVQRGNNRQACFTCDADIAAYAHWLAEGAAKYKISIHAWVFMTNHVHLLLTPQTTGDLSRLMQYIGRYYVRRFNYQYTRTGTLFDGRFKSSVVQQENYLMNCLQYIDLNPVRAGMVQDPGDFKWSSYRTHAFGDRASMWVPHPAYSALGATDRERQSEYRALVSESLPIDAIAKIRHCINKGLVLGTQSFREQVSAMRN
jgi:putative transposase